MEQGRNLNHLKPAGMVAEEWSARLELAACYRAFDWLGWTESIYNHITVRVPGSGQQYLINPYGLNYNEVTASNLVRIDVAGDTLDGSKHPVNKAGFVIHGAIHAARQDAHCIIHTHTTAGMAVACKEGGLRHDNFYSAILCGQIATHDFEGISTDVAERPRLVKSLGTKSILLLRNHGLLVVGSHLWHGASSALQSLGVSHAAWTPRLLGAGKAFAILIAGGFIVIALWAHLIGGRR